MGSRHALGSIMWGLDVGTSRVEEEVDAVKVSRESAAAVEVSRVAGLASAWV